MKSAVDERKQKTHCLYSTLITELQSLLNSFFVQLNNQTENHTQWTNDLSQDMNSKKVNIINRDAPNIRYSAV